MKKAMTLVAILLMVSGCGNNRNEITTEKIPVVDVNEVSSEAEKKEVALEEKEETEERPETSTLDEEVENEDSMEILEETISSDDNIIEESVTKDIDYNTPKNIIESLDTLLINLEQVNNYIGDVEVNSENLNNLNFSPTFQQYKSDIMDLYIDSRQDIMKLSFYYFHSDSQPPEELYSYVQTYQEAMYYYYGSIFGIEENSYNSEFYHAGERRLKDLTEQNRTLKSSLIIEDSIYDLAEVNMDINEIHPITALDALWNGYIEINDMTRKRFDSENELSKIPMSDVIDDINEVYFSHEIYKDFIINFDESHYVLEAQKAIDEKNAREQSRAAVVMWHSSLEKTVIEWDKSIDNLGVVFKMADKDPNLGKEYLDNFTVTRGHVIFLDYYFEAKKLLLEQEQALIK